MLVIAVVAWGLAAWSERRQQHSYRWSVNGDSLRVAAFMAPFHRHARELPWHGIDSITAEPDLDRPEVEVLVLHYGFVAYRMPSHSDQSIRGFGSYVDRLKHLLGAAQSGEPTASTLYLDTHFLLTTAAAVLSLVAWVSFFILVFRRDQRSGASEVPR